MQDGVSRSAGVYYTEISQTHPVSDPKEERRLIERWQKHRDQTARNTLIQSHLRFVVTLARKRTKVPDRLQDLIAAGNLGLLKAIDRFDLGKKVRFLTYASCWIQEEMFKEDYATSSLVHVPTYRQKVQRKRAKEFQQALAQHGPDALSVQDLDPGSPEGTTVDLDTIQDHVEEDPTRTQVVYETADANRRLRHAINVLPDREQTVLNLYYGIKDEPRNLVQIASFLGMSPERVRQIKQEGMKLLKDTLMVTHSVNSACDAF